MNCHICRKKLYTINYNDKYTLFYCNEHMFDFQFYLYNMTNECFRYNFHFEYGSIRGDKIDNYTELYKNSYPEESLTKVPWIDIELDNLSVEGPKLFNKLIKLKAFV